MQGISSYFCVPCCLLLFAVPHALLLPCLFSLKLKFANKKIYVDPEE